MVTSFACILTMVVASAIPFVHAGMGDHYTEKYRANIWNEATGQWLELDNTWCLEQEKTNCCLGDDCRLCFTWPNVIRSDDDNIKLIRQGSSTRNSKRCGKRKFCDNSSQTFTEKFRDLDSLHIWDYKVNECGSTEVPNWRRRMLRDGSKDEAGNNIAEYPEKILAAGVKAEVDDSTMS